MYQMIQTKYQAFFGFTIKKQVLKYMYCLSQILGGILMTRLRVQYQPGPLLPWKL